MLDLSLDNYGSGPNGTFKAYINGGQRSDPTLTTTTGITASDTWNSVSFGSRFASPRTNESIYYCEIIMFNTSLSLLDRQKIQGYLAWKWGFQSKLPVNHPYYSATPGTVITWVPLTPAYSINYVVSSTTYDIDCSVSNKIFITLNSSITTQTFSNKPAANVLFKLELVIKQGTGGSKTIAWDSSVTWQNGSPLTLSTIAGKIDIVKLYTIDGGTKWCAVIVGTGF